MIGIDITACMPHAPIVSDLKERRQEARDQDLEAARDLAIIFEQLACLVEGRAASSAKEHKCLSHGRLRW